MKLLLGGFSATLREAHEEVGAITGMLPPMHIEDGGLRINYSLFLFAEGAIYDQYAFDALKACARRGRCSKIYAIVTSLERLIGEGLISLQDFQATRQELLARIETDVNKNIGNLHDWLPCLQSQVVSFQSVLPVFQGDFGTVMTEWDQHTYGVSSCAVSEGAFDRERMVDQAHRILNPGRNLKNVSRTELEAVIRPCLESVVTNILLADHFDSFPYAWQTMAKYYQGMYRVSVAPFETATKGVAESENVFRLAFPEFAPRSEDDWIKLLKDRRVADLRSIVGQAVRNGTPLDADFGRSALLDLADERDHFQNRLTRFIGVAAEATSITAGMFAGHLFGLGGHVAGGYAGYVAGEVIRDRISRRMPSKYPWLYFTQLVDRPHKQRTSRA